MFLSPVKFTEPGFSDKGIYLINSSYGTIKNNTIKNNGIGTTGDNAVRFDGYDCDSVIDENCI